MVVERHQGAQVDNLHADAVLGPLPCRRSSRCAARRGPLVPSRSTRWRRTTRLRLSDVRGDRCRDALLTDHRLVREHELAGRKAGLDRLVDSREARHLAVNRFQDYGSMRVLSFVANTLHSLDANWTLLVLLLEKIPVEPYGSTACFESRLELAKCSIRLAMPSRSTMVLSLQQCRLAPPAPQVRPLLSRRFSVSHHPPAP